MSLDVFFRRDCANFLRATAYALDGGVRLSAELLDGLTTQEQSRLIAAYNAGARDALISTGLAFGLEPVGPTIQGKGESKPEIAGLLWAEVPHS
jgi:hypothetical protein